MTWADLEARTNAAVLAALGEDITIAGVTVRADYVEPSDQVGLGGVSAVANVPQVVVLSSAVPANPVGKPVMARGRKLTVADARPDGRGMTVLMLEAA